MMTSQEVFDRVVSHLRKQGRKSFDEDGCMYRGPDGTSCAVGCIINDDEYSPTFERSNVHMLLQKQDIPILLKERLLPHVQLLKHLQGVHDGFDPEHWEGQLQLVADRFNLVLSPKE